MRHSKALTLDGIVSTLIVLDCPFGRELSCRHYDDVSDLLAPGLSDVYSAQEAWSAPDGHLMIEGRLSGDEIKRMGRIAGSNQTSIREYLRVAGLRYTRENVRI